MSIMNPIELYLSTLDNIICYYSRRKDDRNKKLFFARVPILKRVKNKLFLELVWHFLTIIEPIISTLVVSVLLPTRLFKTVCTRTRLSPQRIFLTGSHLLLQRVRSSDINYNEGDWVILPGKRLRSTMVPNGNAHSVFERLNFIDVIVAYGLALVAIWSAISKTKFKYLLRTYSCLDYYLTYRFLRNTSIETELVFLNHIDRWASLFDNAHQEKKVLLQHGIEMHDANWPVKLKNVDSVYVLSMEEGEYLFRAVFAKRPRTISVLKATITLTPIMGNKTSVLIVGFPGYGLIDKERTILNRIRGKNVDVYLKPHPGSDDMTLYQKIAADTDTRLILNQTFPDVDIVVSYTSTLAVEYQAYGKIVLYYNEHSLDDIVDVILTFTK